MRECSIIDILRKPKIFNMSIFDWVATLLGGWLIARFLHKRWYGSYNYLNFLLSVEILLIITGIIVHKLLGVDTMLGYYLNLNPKPIRTPCV